LMVRKNGAWHMLRLLRLSFVMATRRN